MSMFIPKSKIVKLDHVNEAVMIISSPIKLMEGGRARFVRLAIIHQMLIRGKTVCSPRANIIVRLWIRS